jgi:hypothetical protein
VAELFLSVIKCACVHDGRQTEIHTAEPMVPQPSAFEVEMAIEKSHISLYIDQIPAELIKAGVEYFAPRSINFENN